MKTRLLILIGVLLVGIFVVSPAYASFSDSILIFVEGSFTKMYYSEKNIESVTFDYDSASVIFETGDNAELEIKTPIVYETGPNIFILKNGEEIAPETTTDDCFYYINIQTETSEKIEIMYAYWPEYPQTLELCETFDVPPLKQFKFGVPFSEIKCNGNLLLTQRYDDSPACVTESTKQKLIERGWVSNMIIAVQSRDVFLDPQDAISSYMEKIIPTLDDFKNILSEPYSIDTIFSKFGEPHKDIGSGIHIYVYELNDNTEVWIGYVDDIWYVKHVDLNGNILEELFKKNE